ncbi:alpha-1,4-glucan--maltose-1-phosphate maltosyltransferase [Paracoccus sp. WLY502]|uniref:alpha-1,4-glucan--maltose-1-phosphate maltosyltransferase n=1 Tax=Paracoccus yibinensis TaxID=3068891 RepID=UPI0027963D33|nr:alpha-1,4-glucan--maltose-1-phosphate maltosyltransferase [Paracoccus sp. WLY502]MDQ1902268.1 alpha-1,4-glucan--maltose-1-phosphate maltosyltransferase [Paracoccus sp. WLY502]
MLGNNGTNGTHQDAAPGTAGTRSQPDPEARSDARLRALAAQRIAIEGVSIEIDGGRFPAKAVAGQPTVIEADIFSDGHDSIAAAILWRRAGDEDASESAMTLVENDRWATSVVFSENDYYECTILAWRDLFTTWHKEVTKKLAAGQRIALELEEGRRLLQAGLEDGHASGEARATVIGVLAADSAYAEAAGDDASVDAARFARLGDPSVLALMQQFGPRTNLTEYKTLTVFVDRKPAAFSAWYELMPRSQSGDVNRHGTFDDVIARLPYVRDLGFDVLYFPPIHPIGKTNRKGRNNSLTAQEGEPGSPYAIGSEAGGHDAIHPELGSFDDFRRLIAAAKDHGLEIALDFAIQCSPDHPWIREHPEWFDWRPDGTIKFAENPPKKYEDIVNVHFYRGAIPSLWYALRDVVLFWVDQGVRIFRVDNPHTKPFPFWEWLIEEVRRKDPGVIFLAEAFTRPKVMKRLAKLGYSQSYSYFTWRNEKQEIIDYLTELTQEECREYMRPNFFVNTPDINPRFLQTSGRPGFRTRLVLAATLGGNYGVYNGFEICEAAPVPGKEEYLNSEKYEIRAWDMNQPGNIQDDIRLMNRLRRTHPALQDFTNVKFYNASSDKVLSYGKQTGNDFVLIHVNLDPHNTQAFEFEVPLWEFGLPDEASVEVRDLIHGNSFTWHGKNHWLELEPHSRPYAIWQLFAPGVPR